MVTKWTQNGHRMVNNKKKSKCLTSWFMNVPLAENSPLALLNFYNLDTLEEVFLKLCVKAEKENGGKIQMLQSWTGSTRSKNGNLGLVYPGITACNDDLSIQAISYCAKNPSKKLQPEEAKVIRDSRGLNQDFTEIFPPKKAKNFNLTWPNLAVLLALSTKNVIKLSRNLTGLLFVFLLPIIEVVFFCTAIGADPKNLKFAIVNDEFSGSGNCTVKDGCDFNNLSCRFVTYLDQKETFLLEYVEEIEEAEEMVKNGQVWGFAHFHSNFSEAFLNRIWNHMDSDEITRLQSTTQVSFINCTQTYGEFLQIQLKYSVSRALYFLISEWYIDMHY